MKKFVLDHKLVDLEVKLDQVQNGVKKLTGDIRSERSDCEELGEEKNGEELDKSFGMGATRGRKSASH